MLYDLHTHSRFSQDGHPTIFQMCEAALKNGLTGLTVTDHFDLSYDPIGFPFYMEHEAQRREEFEEAREQFSGRLDLLWGLELGNPQYYPDIARQFLESRLFDFILGSVHFTPDGQDIYLIQYGDQAQIDEFFSVYLNELLHLIEFGGFDSLAHLDYPLRVMRGKTEPCMRRYEEAVDRVLRSVIEKGLALEINTRGLMDWKNRTEPEEWVLRRFYELGGRMITIGSDAHKHEIVGFEIRQAAQIASRIGFEGMTVFRGRQPALIPFDSVGSTVPANQ